MIKKTTILAVILAVLLVSCVSDSMPPAATIENTPEETSIPAPLLSSTLTPIPPIPTQAQVTPTALYAPLELSSADREVYQKALIDIPVYRQGDIQINLIDEKGSPLLGYQVKYRQISHDFMFGGISNNYDTGALRQAGINTWGVQASWYWIQSEYGNFDLDFTNYWLGIDELKSGGMVVRVNGFYDPADLPPFYGDASYDEFLTRLYDHEAATVQRFSPSVDYWEAVLEPNLGNHNPLYLTKDEYYQVIATSIQSIRDNDPTATVEINFSYPCGGIDWLDNFQILQEMLDRNIDFDVVGLQFYYNAFIGAGSYQMPNMPLNEMSSCYDRYESMLSPYAKKVVGSEFSVPSNAPIGQTGFWGVPWSEDTQAQYLETAYTIFFSKPSNLGLVWWNTVDPSPFVYSGGLIREDGTPKKSYYALQRLIKSWTTSGETVTDGNGILSFRGFGGNYELEIVNPDDGASMFTQVHLSEQDSTVETITFIPNNALLEKKAGLEDLVDYWETKSEQGLVQTGRDYLALIEHHIQNSEWAMAEQTLNAALNDLSIHIEMSIPVNKLIPVGAQGEGFTLENGSALIWGSTTLYLPYDFPEGKVVVEIKAHAQIEKGEAPMMVSGVGANYSPVWKVESTQPELFSYTLLTTGEEKVMTIRFPYDDRIYERITSQNGNVGELKLYIDEVRMVIATTEIP